MYELHKVYEVYKVLLPPAPQTSYPTSVGFVGDIPTRSLLVFSNHNSQPKTPRPNLQVNGNVCIATFAHRPSQVFPEHFDRSVYSVFQQVFPNIIDKFYSVWPNLMESSRGVFVRAGQYRKTKLLWHFFVFLGFSVNEWH